MEQKLSVFEKYLTLWVALCIVGGIVLGKAAPGNLICATGSIFVVAEVMEEMGANE